MSWNAKRYGKRGKHRKIDLKKLGLKPHKGRNLHHLTPYSCGGKEEVSNLLLIDIHKHELWHQLWGNRTIEEVLELLTRVARAKANQFHRFKKGEVE